MMNELEQSDSSDSSDSSEPEVLRPNRDTGAVAYPSDEKLFSYRDVLSISSIHKAVHLGDLNCVKQIIKKGKSPNVNDNFGYTSLHLAVDREKVDILEYLLTLPDINIDARTHIGETPLFLSINLGFEHISLKLIEAGADITIPNLQNETPLHVAVTNSLCEVAKKLIEKGVDINAIDMDGFTPLHEAVQCENFEMLCMLLYHGADTSYKTLQGITPFMLALNNSVSKEIQEELFRYEVDFNMESCDGCPLLFFAINTDSPLIMDIINSGANVNYNVGGRTALDMILYSKRPELFYYILPLVDFDNLLQGNYSIFSSVINCPFPSDDWLNMVFSLITCDKAQELVEQFLQLDFYCNYFTVFALLFAKKGIEEKEFVTFVDISLCLGVDVYFADIEKVYEIYGYDEALSRLLMMEIKDLNTVKNMSVVILFCDIKTNMTDLLNKLPLQCYVGIEVIKILDFCTPGQKFQELFYTMNEFTVQNEIIRKCKQIFKNRTVPSLIELSRNKTRESICAKYNITSSHNFFHVLRKLNLPQVIKDIITCKRAIYSS